MSRSQRVARNITSGIVTQIATWSLTLVVGIFVDRYLKDVGSGKQYLAQTVVLFAGLAVALGTDNVLVRNISVDHDQAGDYAVATLLQRVLIALPVGLVLGGIMPFLSYEPEIKLLIGINYVSMVFALCSAAFSAVLQGLERINRTNRITLATFLLGSALVLWAIYQRQSLVAITLWSLLVNVIGFVAFLWELRPLPLPATRHLHLARQIVLQGLPFLSYTIFMQTYNGAYPIILKHISGDAANGWFQVVIRLLGSAVFLPTIITGAMLPALNRLQSEEPEKVIGVAQNMMRLLLFAALPVSTMMVLLLPILIPLLKGETFRPSGPVAVAIGIGTPLWFVTIGMGTLLIVRGLQGAFAKIAGVAAAVVIPFGIGCVWLGERYLHNGALGAAISQDCVEGLILVGMLRVLPADLKASTLLAGTGGFIVAGLPLVAAIYVRYIYGVAWGLGTAGVALAAYPLLCYQLHSITPSDLNTVRSAFLRKTRAAT